MILVTGGAGYIGSHTVRKLLEKNHKVLIVDNLSRGHKESLPKDVTFENCDLLDEEKLRRIIFKYDIESVIHFAAFAYVGESVEHPDFYYINNVSGGLNLINSLKDKGVKEFVFSSTCSVYGNPENIPIPETEKTKPINPYAKTKLNIENILEDYDTAFGMKYAALRYFNAAGASDDGAIGESHNPEPHLIPLVLYTALGKKEKINIYGDDYDTPDGTCIRDYIHVNDLAEAHIKALDYIEQEKKSLIVNLGTGFGYSVKEIVETAKEITGMEIKSEITYRRPGDPGILIADNTKARNFLKWEPRYNLEKILETAWNWHKNQKY